MFFCQIADQAFQKFDASDDKQDEEGKKGQDAGGEEAADQGADTAGGGDKDRRNAGQKKQREDFHMHFFCTVGKPCSQGIKRNCSQKNKQSGNSVGHGYSPQCEFTILYGWRVECGNMKRNV